MKKVIILTCAVLLTANLLCGAILSSYNGCNLALSSAVIIVSAVLLYLVDSISIKDGYKVSLMLLFITIGLLEFILSLMAPNQVADNWWLIVVITLMAIQAITLIITRSISSKLK